MIGDELRKANEVEQFAQDIQKMDLYARSQKAIDHRKEDPLADVDFIRA